MKEWVCYFWVLTNPSLAPRRDLEIRYSVAAETRNNLVAAGQNINGAQRYLDNVNFPYCAPGEVDTLNKVMSMVAKWQFLGITKSVDKSGR